MKELIYNQKKIPKKQWRYGLRSSAAVGCGWIAVYNALVLMGCKVYPEKLIRYFERQVPFINGNLGTVIPGPALYFKKRGFDVKIAVRRRRFDELAAKSDVCVLYYRWLRKWKYGAHFVALRYQDGIFTGYNTFSNSNGPDVYGESLEGFLKAKKYFGAVLIGIKNERSLKH